MGRIMYAYDFLPGDRVIFDGSNARPKGIVDEVRIDRNTVWVLFGGDKYPDSIDAPYLRHCFIHDVFMLWAIRVTIVIATILNALSILTIVWSNKEHPANLLELAIILFSGIALVLLIIAADKSWHWMKLRSNEKLRRDHLELTKLRQANEA